tara:strand:+ start:1317 stop:1607 length:291 start_codon:yes stop_codon:yes gene_type:complete
MIANRYKKTNVYYSDVQGAGIKDAITGEIYPWKVGSYDEQRFFKVKDNSLLNKYDSEFQEGHTLFFKNPDDYMNFNKIQLDDETIEVWKKRQEKFI